MSLGNQSAAAVAAPAAVPAPAEGAFPRERRFIFVQLLFSLTAAEIARQSAELTLLHRETMLMLPAYFHLVLATIVVATSWVGWSVSTASLRLRVDSVFGWPFVVLLIDVFLVILYFILVRGAEIPRGSNELVPSPSNELITIACIMGGYFLWDVVTKAIIYDGRLETPLTFSGRFFGRSLWARGWITFVCMLLSIALAVFLLSVTSSAAVEWVDVSLVFFVLLFRAMKERRRLVSVVLFIGTIVAAVAARCVA